MTKPTPIGEPDTSKVVPMNEAQRRLATASASLKAGDALRKDRNHLGASDEPEGFGTLTIEQMKCYEKNSRISRNPAYFDIKESIRAKGFVGTLTVSRRPGEKIYTVSAGGNTRLTILKELYEETGDKRFFEINVTIQAWSSESQIIGAHLVENEVRGDTTFWEKAHGLMSLREELEKELGKPVSLRSFESHVRSLGLTTNTSTIGYYVFAVSNLSNLGQYLPVLTRNHVREFLQPRYSQVFDLAKLYGIDEATFSAKVIESGCIAYAESYAQDAQLNPTELCALWETRLGEVMLPARSAQYVSRALNLRTAFNQLKAHEIDQRLSDEQQRLESRNGTSKSPSRSDGPAAPGSQSTPNAANAQDTQPVTAGRAAVSSSSTTESARTKAMRVYVLDQAKRFAQLTGVEDCFTECVECPFGFFMEVPMKTLHEGNSRRQGWWMLALVSRQADAAVYSVCPASSTWYGMNMLEGYDEAERDRIHAEELAQPPSSAVLLRWLQDPHFSAGMALAALIEGTRELEGFAAERAGLSEAA